MKLSRYLVTAVLGALLVATSIFGGPAAVFGATVSDSLQVIGPLTRDTGALSTFAATAGSTVNTTDQTGFNVSRVVCVFRQSTYTGSPSTTFAIQNKDSASGQYYSLVTSSAITTSTSAIPLAAGAGVATTANVGAGLPLARNWRVQTVIAGSSTPLITGTVACSVQ